MGKTVRNTTDGRDKKNPYRVPKWVKKVNKKKDRADVRRFLKHKEEEGFDGTL